MNNPKISVQEAHLHLIRNISFNSFDGEAVYEGLVLHRDLWVGVISGYTSRNSHPALRLFDELPEDSWHADTLWIMAVNSDAAAKIAELCKAWEAEAIDVYNAAQAKREIGTDLIDDEVLVSAWWD
jgi:hypothetical protein